MIRIIGEALAGRPGLTPSPDHASPMLIALVSLALLIFPFVNILHFAIPMPDLAGKSAWLLLVTGGLVLASISAANPINRDELRTHKYVIAAAIAVFGSVILRSIYYGEPLIPINFRYSVTALFCITLSAALIRRGALNFLACVLWAQGILVALLVYANMNYFPNILLSSDQGGLTGIIFNGERTRSMLMNASVGSNTIVASMFVLVAWARRRQFGNFRSNVLFWTTLIFMAYCVSLTGTRYAILASLCVILLSLWISPKKSSLAAIAIAIPLLMVTSFVLGAIIEPILTPILSAQVHADNSTAMPNWRFEQDGGGRLEKLGLALKMLSNGPINFLLGASFEEIRTTRSDNLMVFSDNSFGTILLEAGVPVGLFLIAAWGAYLNRFARNLLGAAFLVYFVGTLSLTNSVLWDSWFCSVLFMFPVISGLGGPAFARTRRNLEPPTSAPHFSGN